MRLGLFGGSFDPVHLGHLELAQACQRQVGLDQVWFVLAAAQPLKEQGPYATAEQRVAMLELALQDQPSWSVCRLELDRGGTSYTADTLRQVHALQPAAELFFLMGADSLHDLPRWREPEVVCTLATPVVVVRQGEPQPDLEVLTPFVTADRLAAIQRCLVTTPPMAVSSRDIRAAIARAKSVRGMLPPAVEAYLHAQQLYREGSS